MAFRDMDSMCFEPRSNWSQRKLDLPGLPDVSLQMLPDRLPSLSEYVPDDFPSPQLKEDLEGNLIVQLDKDYPRSSAQDVLPRSCFDVLNNQGMATETAHSLISTSLATIGGFQSTWPQLDSVPTTSIDHFSASLGTGLGQNLRQDRNSPFAPSLREKAATFRELSSAHLVSTQNSSFQSTAFPLQNNFRVVSSLGSQPVPDCGQFSEKPLLSSSGTGYSGRELLQYPWSGPQQQQYPGSSLATSTDRKPPSLVEAAASSPELSKEYKYSSGSPLEDCSVTWSTGSTSSSGLARVDNRNVKTPPLRKRALDSTGNMEDAEARKLEMKRAKNREAAQRCQQRKQERIVRLEGKVGKLKEQNVALTQTVRGLREQIAWLQRQVVTHANNGCQLSVPRFFAS